MECPNCLFQNTPGMAACVRCRGRLDFGGVDYLPPRARGSRALWRLRDRVAVWRLRAHERVVAFARRVGAAICPDADWGAIFRSIVPGLGHWRLGQRSFGLAIFVAWCALLVLALAAAGSGRSWLLVSIAVALHCTVISLLLRAALAQETVRRRLCAGLLTWMILVACLYGPAWYAGRQLVRVVPVHGIRSGEALSSGDVLACSGPWTTLGGLEPGELVLYQIHQAGAAGVMILGGWGVDRIVGLPGEVVSWDGAVLLINGALPPQERRPLGSIGQLPPFEMMLGPREYAIVPSMLLLTGQGPPVSGRQV